MKSFLTTIITALFIFTATTGTARATAAAVPAAITGIHSIGTVTGESVTVKALVKGAKTGSPYRLRLLPIQKQIIGQWLKAGAGAVLRRSPYWIAATAAMGLLVSDTGDITAPPSGIEYVYTENHYWKANNGPMGYTKYGACLNLASTLSGYTYKKVTDNKCVLDISWSSNDYYADLTIHQCTQTQINYGNEYCINPYLPDDSLYQSISDIDFQDKVIQYIAANPSVDALTDPDNPTSWGHIEPQGLTYIPEAENGQDEAWIQSVLDGAAQSTDATADNYVPADQLARIEALAQQIADGQTAEGATDAANAAAEAAVTQGTIADMIAAQQNAAAVAGDAAVVDMDQTEEEINSEFDTMLENLTPPEAGDFTFMPGIEPLPCKSFDFSYMGASVQIPGQHCDKIEQGKVILGYLLFFLTAWNIFFTVTRELN